VYSRFEHESGVGVAQIVQSKVRQSHPSNKLDECAGDGVGVERCAVRVAEDEVVVAKLFAASCQKCLLIHPVLLQEQCQRRWQRYGSPAVGSLGLLDDIGTVVHLEGSLQHL
jgi:hypothetical protein